MKNLVDYVNPNIGTIGQLLQVCPPLVLMPHGMLRAMPVFTPGIRDFYLADKIYAFPTGAGMIMPTIGRDTGDFDKNASCFDHDFERVTPYEYSVLLEDYDINCSFTVDKHSIIYKIDMPCDGYLIAYMPMDSRAEKDGIFTGENANPGGIIGGVMFNSTADFEEIPTTKDNSKCYRYKLNKGTNIVKAAFSYIDIKQAMDNLNREIPSFDYDRVKQNCMDAWNKKLGAIEVKGENESEIRYFYTSLYRVMSRMNSISEYGRYYSGYDNAVHNDEGHEFYINDSIWDTFRGAHPLQMIIEPDVHRDIIESYIRMDQQGGSLPSFSHVHGQIKPIMLGNHAASLFLDSFVNGFDFDTEAAYQAVKKKALEISMLPWTNCPKTELDEFYHKNGFFPALGKGDDEYVAEVHSYEKRQSVAVTLENAFDAWCIAQLAKHLGKKQDEELFLKKSKNYVNLFNKETGFMQPKTMDGNWVKNFNPKTSGGRGGREYYAENNAWIYTFNVMHDNLGLIKLFGGNDKFNEKLDRLFVEPAEPNKFMFIGQFPDCTGLEGQFCMGNEPSFHIPYLYNYSGQPWKTQKKVRHLMKLWFFDSPLGVCGDEDGGAMSAWYALSALGFYPVCPGSGFYDIGSPLFEEVIINNGKTKLTIKSHGASKAKYIESVTINGEEIKDFKLTSKHILCGGELIFKMSERPIKN